MDEQGTFEKVMVELGKLPGDLPYPLKDVLAKHKAAQAKAAKVDLHPTEKAAEAATKGQKKAGCQCPTCQILGANIVAPKAKPSEATTVVTGVPVEARPEWGLKEAIREFILNTKDAETEFEVQSTVEALEIATNDGDAHLGIVMTTPGAHLPKDALQGKSLWKSKSGLYGRFGEGILLATAAILRTPGCSLSIVTGGWTYDAKAEKGDMWLGGWYKKPLVAFTLTPQADYEQGVQIQIDGVPKNVWNEVMSEFSAPVFKDIGSAPLGGKVISTKRGKILLDPKEAGRIWLRSFRLPQTFPLKCGYVFEEGLLTRDRTLDPSVEIPYETAVIWAEALVSAKTKTLAAAQISTVANAKTLDALFLDHVVPLTKLASTDDLTKALHELDDLEKVGVNYYKKVEYDSLTPDEQYNLNLSMAILLGKHAPKMLNSVEIFEGVNVNWQNSAAKVCINRKNLSARHKTLVAVLGSLAEFQSKFVDTNTKNASPLMWASVMATSSIERIWGELEAANKVVKAVKQFEQQKSNAQSA